MFPTRTRLAQASRAFVVSACFAVASQAGAIAAAADGDVLITDPAMLEELGFSAENPGDVYVTQSVYNKLVGVEASGADRSDASASPAAGIQYVSLLGASFDRRDNRGGVEDSHVSRFTASDRSPQNLGGPGGPLAYYTAQLPSLPEGALLEYFDIKWHTNAPVNRLVATLYESCHATFGNAPTVIRVLAHFDGAGRPTSPNYRHDFETLPGYQITNASCAYSVQIGFGQAGQTLQKVRVGYLP